MCRGPGDAAEVELDAEERQGTVADVVHVHAVFGYRVACQRVERVVQVTQPRVG